MAKRRELRRSLLAGGIGIASAVLPGATLVVVDDAPLDEAFLPGIGLLVLLFLVPGWVVGLLDRKRPLLTAALTAAAMAVALSCLAVARDLSGGEGLAPVLRDVGLAFSLMLGVGALVAVAGAKAAQFARGRRAYVWLPTAMLVGLIGCAVLPAVKYHRTVRQFKTAGLPNLQALASRELGVAVPAHLDWTCELTDPMFGMHTCQANWSVAPGRPDGGKCTLTGELELPVKQGPNHAFVEIDLDFRPRREVVVTSEAEALQRLRAICTRPPPTGLKPDKQGDWYSHWPPQRDPRTITVSHSGEVTVSTKASIDQRFAGAH